MNTANQGARIFFALLPDARTRQDLVKVQAQLSPRGGRVVPASNLHLTLLFLGLVARNRLETLCLDCPAVAAAAFSMQITHTGWWAKPGICWIGPGQTPVELSSLVKQLKVLAASRGIMTESRTYVPHVTLLRHAHTAPAQPWFRPIPWTADSFSLMESVSTAGGVQYHELGNWPLR